MTDPNPNAPSVAKRELGEIEAALPPQPGGVPSIAWLLKQARERSIHSDTDSRDMSMLGAEVERLTAELTALRRQIDNAAAEERERCANWHDSEAERCAQRRDEFRRYSDEPGEAAAWRSFNTKWNAHRYYAASLRALPAIRAGGA